MHTLAYLSRVFRASLRCAGPARRAGAREVEEEGGGTAPISVTMATATTFDKQLRACGLAAELPLAVARVPGQPSPLAALLARPDDARAARAARHLLLAVWRHPTAPDLDAQAEAELLAGDTPCPPFTAHAQHGLVSEQAVNAWDWTAHEAPPEPEYWRDTLRWTMRETRLNLQFLTFLAAPTRVDVRYTAGLTYPSGGEYPGAPVHLDDDRVLAWGRADGTVERVTAADPTMRRLCAAHAAPPWLGLRLPARADLAVATSRGVRLPYGAVLGADWVASADVTVHFDACLDVAPVELRGLTVGPNGAGRNARFPIRVQRPDYATLAMLNARLVLERADGWRWVRVYVSLEYVNMHALLLSDGPTFGLGADRDAAFDTAVAAAAGQPLAGGLHRTDATRESPLDWLAAAAPPTLGTQADARSLRQRIEDGAVFLARRLEPAAPAPAVLVVVPQPPPHPDGVGDHGPPPDSPSASASVSLADSDVEEVEAEAELAGFSPSSGSDYSGSGGEEEEEESSEAAASPRADVGGGAGGLADVEGADDVGPQTGYAAGGVFEARLKAAAKAGADAAMKARLDLLVSIGGAIQGSPDTLPGVTGSDTGADDATPIARRTRPKTREGRVVSPAAKSGRQGTATVSTLYGELSFDGLELVWRAFRAVAPAEKDGGQAPGFVDFGSGFGRAVFYSYLVHGARALGLEYATGMVDKAQQLRELLAYEIRSRGGVRESFTGEGARVTFEQGDFTEILTLNSRLGNGPHFFFGYDISFSRKTARAMAQLARDAGITLFCSFLPPQVYKGAGLQVVFAIADMPTTSRGEGAAGEEAYPAFFYVADDVEYEHSDSDEEEAAADATNATREEQQKAHRRAVLRAVDRRDVRQAIPGLTITTATIGKLARKTMAWRRANVAGGDDGSDSGEHVHDSADASSSDRGDDA